MEHGRDSLRQKLQRFILRQCQSLAPVNLPTNPPTNWRRRQMTAPPRAPTNYLVRCSFTSDKIRYRSQPMSALPPNVLQNSLPHCDSATIESSSMARRINVAHFCLILNQCCVCCPLKIVLQHNPPKSGHVQCKVRCPLRAAGSTGRRNTSCLEGERRSVC